MNDLRWILITCGALLLVAIYVWGRRSDKREGKGAGLFVPARPEPPVEADFAAPSYEDDDVVGQSVAPLEDAYAADQDVSIRAPSRHDSTRWASTEAPRAESSRSVNRGVRVEPTLGGSDLNEREAIGEPQEPASYEPDSDPAITAELPVENPVAAPTLSMSSTPPPRRIERRKIIALRLAAGGQRYPGESLRSAMEAESLQFGRYDVFHFMHEDGSSIFSIASMVEPGTFDLERMGGQQYSGVTMFAQLPGPVPGVDALRDLVACGKRLQETLGGTLQDERGVPLTVHRVDRLRQEIVDFERSQARDLRATPQH